MTPLSKNARVLRQLIELSPGISRTTLIKLAYLADCEARVHLGRPISDFRYSRDNYGPFDSAMYDARDELLERGLLTEEETKIFGHRAFIYSAANADVESGLDQVELEILKYVASTFSDMTATQLCEEIVYQTRPMADAEIGDELPMDQLNFRHRAGELGFDLSRMIAGEASVDAGRHRPLREAIDELRARHHT